MQRLGCWSTIVPSPLAAHPLPERTMRCPQMSHQSPEASWPLRTSQIVFQTGKTSLKISSRQVFEQLPLKAIAFVLVALVARAALDSLERIPEPAPFFVRFPTLPHKNFYLCQLQNMGSSSQHSLIQRKFCLQPRLKVFFFRLLNSSQSRVFTSCRLSFWYLVPSSETKL